MAFWLCRIRLSRFIDYFSYCCFEVASLYILESMECQLFSTIFVQIGICVNLREKCQFLWKKAFRRDWNHFKSSSKTSQRFKFLENERQVCEWKVWTTYEKVWIVKAIRFHSIRKSVHRMIYCFELNHSERVKER